MIHKCEKLAVETSSLPMSGLKAAKKTCFHILNCLLICICPKHTTLVHSLRNSKIARFRGR